jgi:hypothetical protein
MLADGGTAFHIDHNEQKDRFTTLPLASCGEPYRLLPGSFGQLENMGRILR